MYLTTTGLVLLVLMATVGPSAADPTRPGAKKRSAGDAPAIELSVAVTRARAHAKKLRIDLRSQYLQAAVFDPVERVWSVVWQRPNAKGGRTELLVPELGAIEVVYGE